MPSETKQIFLEACEKISMLFEPFGFRFLKSRQRMVCKEAEWKFEIHFWTSRTNCLASIALRPYASATNTFYAEWRESSESPFRKDGFIASGVLGNLFDAPAPYYSEWKLSDNPAIQERVVSDVIQRIQNTALPFFSLVKSPEKLCAHLIEREINAFYDPGEATEYLLFLAGKDAATSYLNVLLEKEDVRADDVKKMLSRIETGIPSDVSVRFTGKDRFLYSLAKASFHYKIPFSL